MSIYNYVVSAQKPTATNFAATGAFTGKDDLNLLVAKFNCVEVYVVTAEGLRLVHEVPLYARLSAMHVFRAQGQEKDWLLIFTERQLFSVLSYNPVTHHIMTEAAGTLRNDVGKLVPLGPISSIDPEGRMFLVHQYVGMLKVVPMDKAGKLQEAVNIRLEELSVIDITFLHNCTKPTIAVLYTDGKQVSHLKTYEVNVQDGRLDNGPWSQPNTTAKKLIAIPKPAGGVLAVGSETIMYRSTAATVSISAPSNDIDTYGLVDTDGQRILLGDGKGFLYVLSFVRSQVGVVNNMHFRKVGEISRPSALAYLDNGVVYVGSRLGDSQLIHLRDEPDENGSEIAVMEAYTNIGPIVDFCVIDLERQGQVVTCSGCGKDGSLRIIRSGVGINEAASIELPSIKGLWSLKTASGAAFDAILAVSFIGQTRFLVFDGDDPVVSEIPHFVTDEQTLYSANLVNDLMVQVTASTVTVVDAVTQSLSTQWKPPAGLSISIATTTPSQVLVTTTGGYVVYLEVEGKHLVERRTTKLPSEISCITAGLVNAATGLAEVCAIGLWSDMSVRLLRVADFTEVAVEHLDGDYIARSVSLPTFAKSSYLLVGLGDGQLYSFNVNASTCALSDRQKVAVGTQPISLDSFSTQKSNHVFASSDRPTIIHESNGKLLFSNINIKDVVNFMSPFNSEAFPNHIAIASDSGLTIGTIDDVQKLHIQSIPLREEPRRISYQPSSLTLAVSTIANDQTSMTPEVETGHLRLIDAQTHESLDDVVLDVNEEAWSLISLAFEGSATEYFVLGTGINAPEQELPHKGYIRVFEVTETRRLRQVSVLEVRGAVLSMDKLHGKLVASINNSVHVFAWQEAGSSDSFKLTSETNVQSFLAALYVKTRGDFVVVGDLMKSASLLRYNTAENAHSLEEVAKDNSAAWVTSVAIVDDDVLLISDNDYNWTTFKKTTDAVNPDDAKKLEVAGLFHYGDMINQIRPGSLVMRSPDHDLASVPTFVFCTVSGALGVIASIPQTKFNFMKRVQDNLVRIIKGVGGFDHTSWRNFRSEQRSPESFNYLDGDLIELFLELDQAKKEAVIRGDQGGQQLVDVTVEDLTRTIDEFARLH